MGPLADKSARLAATAATLSAMVMIAQQIGSKATRDALFLSNHPAIDLPKVVIASAGLSVLAVLLATRAFDRFGPARVVPPAFLLNAALYVGEWTFAKAAGPTVAIVLYLHVTVLGAILISGFWSAANERFDPHTAKQVISRIGAGATFGGIVGGVAAERVASTFSATHMLLALAAMSVVCALGVRQLRPPADQAAARAPTRAKGSGPRVLLEVPYLRDLGALVLLVGITSALADYALKAQAASELATDRELMAFFAAFYTATAVLAFIFQTSLSKRALERLGLGGTVALLPAAVLLTSVFGAALTRLWTAVVVRAADSVLSNSLYRSAYELLFTPLAPEQKRSTKAIIDVALVRLGDAGGSGLVMLAIFVAPLVTNTVVLALAACAAVFALLIARQLHHGYINTLAESLRTGLVRIDSSEVIDATTKRTVVETTMALDRDRLLAEIERLQEQSTVPSTGSAPTEPAGPSVTAQALLGSATELLSGSSARIRLVLESTPLDRNLVPYVVPLLGRRNLAELAQEALCKVAPRVTGQLIDAILDTDISLSVRRRLPRIVSNDASPLAIYGLLVCLDDEDFDLRRECGRALLRIHLALPDFQIRRRTVLTVVQRELSVGLSSWEARRGLVVSTDGESPLLRETTLSGIDPSLEHVFTLLSLCYDAEGLALSLRALSHEDQSLRGNALEYVENVVPEFVWKALLPYLGVQEARSTRRARAQAEILDDMVRSMGSPPAGSKS